MDKDNCNDETPTEATHTPVLERREDAPKEGDATVPKRVGRQRVKRRVLRGHAPLHADKAAPGKGKRGLLIGKTARRALIICAAILFAAACGNLYLVATSTETLSNEDVKYYHTVDIDSVYEVSLVPNELYPDAVMGEGLVYAKKLTDSLNVHFYARYRGSAPAAVKVEYAIDAVVSAYRGSGDTRMQVYSHTFPIANGAPGNDTGSVDIDKKVTLDINAYNAFADEAEVILAAVPSREITVVFSGIFHVDTDFGTLDEPFTYIYTLQADTSLFTIEKPAAIQRSSNITENTETVIYPRTEDMVLPILLTALGALTLLAVIFATRKPDASEERIMFINKLQRTHASRLVKLDAPLSPAEVESIYVADMDSLIKVSDEVQCSICYFPDERGLPSDGCFYIPHHERRYILMLKAYTTIEV